MSANKLKITMSDKLVASMWVDRDEESSKSGVVRRFLENLIPEGKGLA